MSNQAVQTLESEPAPAVEVPLPEAEEVQVQVPEEDGTPQPAANANEEDEPRPQPKKPRQRADKRVENAVGRAIAAENVAADLQRQLAAANARAAELDRGKAQAEIGTFNAIEAQKRSELEKAKQDYKQARATNNLDAETDANERMAAARAALNDVEAWKAVKGQPAAEQPQEQERQQQPQPQAQEPQIVQPIPDRSTLEFVADNPWFDVWARDENGNGIKDSAGRWVRNSDFDQEMHAEAILKHKSLERAYKNGRYEHAPGTPGYFQDISEYMRSEFPDYFGEDDQPQQQTRRTPQMSPSRQPVAPASRSGMPGQNNGTKRADKPTLTRDQADFALSLRNAKAPGYTYPRGHQKAGQPMTDQDALYKHWQEVKKDEPNTVTR